MPTVNKIVFEGRINYHFVVRMILSNKKIWQRYEIQHGKL